MENVLAVVQLLLGGAWNLLTSINVPGTEMSFAVILCGSALVLFGLKVLRLVLSTNNKDLNG